MNTRDPQFDGAGRKEIVVGAGVSATSYGWVLGSCRHWIEQRRRWKGSGGNLDQAPAARSIAFLTVHSVMTAVFHPEYRAMLNSTDIAAPDGMPLALALRYFGARKQRRVYGPDMMLALCGQAAREGHRLFLYGGREETLSVLQGRLTSRFPGLQIVEAYSPPFRPLTLQEDAAIVERIQRSDADLVFVGIGVPKQERWMAEHAGRLPGVVMLAVGAAFDFHAGRVRQAPRWMQELSLEWLFRLLMEPKRLWKRYILLNPLFLTMWGLQMAGILRYTSQPRQQEQRI